MDLRDRDELLASLRSAGTCEQGRSLVYRRADAIDAGTAEAIREESLRPGLGEKAAWFAEWYRDARGAVFISECLAAIAAAGDPRYGVREYLEERKRQNPGFDLDVLHRAARILLAFAPKTVGAMNTLVSGADNAVSGARAIDAARKRIEFEGVEIAALVGVEGARDMVCEMKKEFDGHRSAISGFARLAGDFARASGNRDDLREVLFLEGTLAILEHEMVRLSGRNDGLEALSERARGILAESLAVSDRPEDRTRCLHNLAKTWFDEDRHRSLEYLLQCQAELDGAVTAARMEEERESLEEMRLGTVRDIAAVEITLGRFKAAHDRLAPAIAAVEETIRGLTAPGLVRGVLERHGGLYLAMIEACAALGRDDPVSRREALEYAEKRNGRVFLETLRKGGSFGAGAPPELLDERGRVLEHLEYISRDPSDEEVREIEHLMDRLARLDEEIWRKTLIRTWWLEAVPATYDQIAAQVPADGVLIEYCVLPDRILAFVVDRGTAPDVVEIELDSRALGQIADTLVLAIDLRADYANFAELKKAGLVIPATAPGTNLEFLYRLLVLPLARHLEGRTMAYVVPDSELRRVPFQALYRVESGRPRFLIEDLAVAYAPTASILRLLRTRRQALETCFAAGVPADRGGPEGAEQEAAMVARLFKTTARPATIRNVRSEAGGCNVIHLACHSAGGSVVTMYDGLQLEDGVLLPRESFPVGSSLVTLSACNTYRQDVLSYAELAGMTGHFLRLGARSTVSSLWEVPSEVTCELMREFYACLVRTKDKALALQRAQAATAERYAHPFFWAPFCLVGPAD